MPTLADIKRQIGKLPHRYVFWTEKEIRALPQILMENESIKALTSGFMDGATWLAVCTDKRIIFLNRGMFYGLRQVQIPLDRVQSIDHSFTIVFGSICIWDGASYFTMKMVLKASIEPFVRDTQGAMAEYRKSIQIGTSSTLEPNDIAGQLEKLADLRDRGVLTPEEFAQQKKKLLG